MESLQPLLGKVVVVVTLEGRCLVGTLKGYDSVCNLVLENAFERTFHLDKGMQLEPMGLYLVRGDSLCVHRPLCEVLGERGRVMAPTAPPRPRFCGRSPCSRSVRAPSHHALRLSPLSHTHALVLPGAAASWARWKQSWTRPWTGRRCAASPPAALC